MTDGGAAFPHDRTSLRESMKYEGMSLRDWFAGKALEGMMASGILKRKETLWIAETAWIAADAMIKAREKNEN